MFGEDSITETQYGFDIAKLEPGDILLSRIPMNLHDTSTWDSHLIQSLTRSRFSFAALHLGNGLFIEAVGSGVARLPLWKAGVRDPGNVRVLRLRKGNELAGRRAATIGLRYLQRGFYQQGLPQTKCSAFRDVRRAAAVNSLLVASAYQEAGCSLLDAKSLDQAFPGDFLQARELEDVTSSIVQLSRIPKQPTFYVDDDSLSKRVYHWDVATQLKVVCSYEVRRILDVQVQKPSSMIELEQLIAERHWSPLDQAVYRSLQWYRYADMFQQKQRQFLGDMAGADSGIARVLPMTLNEERLNGALMAIASDMQLLETELAHWVQQRDRYETLLKSYKAKSFAYMLDVYKTQIASGEKLLQSVRQKAALYQNEANSRGARLKTA